MATYSDTVESQVVAQDGSVFNELVQSTGYGNTQTFALNFLEFPVAEAKAETLVFTADLVENAVSFEETVITRSDLKRFYEEVAGVEAQAAQQTLAAEAPLQVATGKGATQIPQSGRGQLSVLQADASGAGTITQQTAQVGSLVVQTHRIAPSVVEGRAHTFNTLVASAGGLSATANLFIDRANSAAVVVSQRRHTRDLITQDATASFVELSARLRQQLRDSLVDAASATGEVAAAQAQARQLLVEAAEVIDELLEVLPRELWVFNSQTLAFSRYTDTLATGVASVESEPAFTGNSGVQRFADDQYADTEVEWGLSNFDSLALKRLVSAYVASAGDANLTLSTRHSLRGKVQEHRYNVPAAPSLAPVTRRCLLARGYLGQYWGVRLQTRGGYATLDNVVITPLVDTRRV